MDPRGVSPKANISRNTVSRTLQRFQDVKDGVEETILPAIVRSSVPALPSLPKSRNESTRFWRQMLIFRRNNGGLERKSGIILSKKATRLVIARSNGKLPHGRTSMAIGKSTSLRIPILGFAQSLTLARQTSRSTHTGASIQWPPWYSTIPSTGLLISTIVKLSLRSLMRISDSLLRLAVY